ncbi:MAG: MarR family transcriptional regulator [archaeon]|nr:MarR family transcriptional regulator [archaeon]
MSEDSLSDGEYAYFRLLMYLPEKLTKCIDLVSQDYLRDTNLKTYFMAYIFHIKSNDGISQKDLKLLIPHDKSRISVVVNELIELGLVYDDGVGRSSSLHLTDSGMNAFVICKMLFDLVGREIFKMSRENYELIKQKNIEFDKHLDSILSRYSKS